jgi:hypothetical protein
MRNYSKSDVKMAERGLSLGEIKYVGAHTSWPNDLIPKKKLKSVQES